jgi:hypothetical protein
MVEGVEWVLHSIGEAIELRVVELISVEKRDVGTYRAGEREKVMRGREGSVWGDVLVCMGQRPMRWVDARKIGMESIGEDEVGRPA